MQYAGTDRLQMVGVRSLQVDGSWLLVSSFFFSWSGQRCSTPRQFLKYVMSGIESYAAHCSSNVCFVYDENVNKIDFIALYCIVGPVLEQVKMPAEERRAKNFKSHRKIVL